MNAASDTLPGFRMLFPAGWTRHDVSVDDERALLERMRQKVRPLARPDIEFQLTAAVKSAFRQLAEKDGIAIYLPGLSESGSALPMSITASRLTDPGGTPLDDRVAVLFRDFGADFLGSDRSIVRWTRTFDRLPTLDGADSTQVNYLIPVPHTERRIALLFSTSIARDKERDVDETMINHLVTLSDAIVSTFSWAPVTRDHE